MIIDIHESMIYKTGQSLLRINLDFFYTVLPETTKNLIYFNYCLYTIQCPIGYLIGLYKSQCNFKIVCLYFLYSVIIICGSIKM